MSSKRRYTIDLTKDSNPSFVDLTEHEPVPRQKQRKQPNPKKHVEPPIHECPVCYVEYTRMSPKRAKVLLPCRHVVCERCVAQLASHNQPCPLCRNAITSTVFLTSYRGQPVFMGGRKVYEGPRGGRYIIVNDNKRYI